MNISLENSLQKYFDGSQIIQRFGSKNNIYVYDSKLRQTLLSVLKDLQKHIIVYDEHDNLQ